MRYVFADCELDTRVGVVRRGTTYGGMRSKPFQILCYLIEHADRVVSTQELADYFGPDLDINDRTIRSTINTLRRAVGDTQREQRIIQTIPRAGFRFVAPVTVLSEEVGGENGEAVQAEARADLDATTTLLQEGEIISPQVLSKPPNSFLYGASVRRQLTVLFCDVVVSDMESAAVDLEDYVEAVFACHDAYTAIITQYEGYISQRLGEAFLVYFGYPHAHEDSARRAVYSALGILEEMASLNDQLLLRSGIAVTVQIGIHTGKAVAKTQRAEAQVEPLAFGEVPTIAMRLQELMAPNTIGISAATYQLVRGYFVCQTLGFQTLRGLPESVDLYQVLQRRQVPSRFEAATMTRDLTPMVGRQNELELLRQLWGSALDGFGAGVFISGEVGIGKSRLVQAFKDQVDSDAYTLLECQTSPYDQRTAFWPLIGLFDELCQWEQHELPDMKVKKLETMLSQFTLPRQETLSLFANLLSLTAEDGDEMIHQMSPPQRRRRLLNALLTILLELPDQKPTLLVVEDLQWADASTLELLGLLIDRISSTRILVLLTFRSDFQPSLKPNASTAHLAVGSLTSQQAEDMILQITHGKKLPAEVLRQLVAKTDGIPLFVEEMTRMVMDSGVILEIDGSYELDTGMLEFAIPTTLHDSLIARLDGLRSGQEIAQLAATIGREFSYDLIRAVVTVDESTLQQELTQLVEADLLRQRGLPPQAHYYFKHVLIQETAYQSLPRPSRRQYHQRIAEVLKREFPETCSTQPERLAHHYTEANLSQKAIVYWHQAAQQALDRIAFSDAAAHAHQGLAALSTLPEDAEHHQHELNFQILLCKACEVPGPGRSERNRAYQRAFGLCEQIGNVTQRFEVFGGLGNWYLTRAELAAANEIAEQLLELAQRENDPILLRKAHRDVATTLFFLGSPTDAMHHIQQALPDSLGQKPIAVTVQYRHLTETALLRYQAWLKHLLGYPEQAFLPIEQAFQLSQHNDLSFGLDLLFKLILHQWRREPDAIHPLVGEVINLTQDKYPLLRARGLIIKGWYVAQQGAYKDAIDLISRGIADYQNTGSEVFIPYFMALLAETYGQMKNTAAGLDTISKALALVHKTGERCWEAELYRLHAELLLRKDSANVAKAEAAFERALAIARQQQFKTLELRAATSLSRMWSQEGKRHQARSLLETIYGWFTEGHDTADLKDAKILLDELT